MVMIVYTFIVACGYRLIKEIWLLHLYHWKMALKTKE